MNKEINMKEIYKMYKCIIFFTSYFIVPLNNLRYFKCNYNEQII